VHKDAPKTAAKSDRHTGQKNLTLGDWDVVFEFVDQHPNVSQRAIVEHLCRTICSTEAQIREAKQVKLDHDVNKDDYVIL
jgi:hypothetical protein